MIEFSVQDKYAQTEVVQFWRDLSLDGLQRCEQEMVARYFPPQGRLLDVGCGTGRATLALNGAGYQVTGLDLSLNMLAAGRVLSPAAPLNGADMTRLPFANHSFDAVFMFFGALQHIPSRTQRRLALAEMARVTQPEGRIILGLDNLAPALLCYGYWFLRKIGSGKGKPMANSESQSTAADQRLWQRTKQPLHILRTHARGLARSIRWRTGPDLLDSLRQMTPWTPPETIGDRQVAQFAISVTPGHIYYHVYRVPELLEDAASAGLQLLGYHSGNELNDNGLYPTSVRNRDKQLFFAFQKRA